MAVPVFHEDVDAVVGEVVLVLAAGEGDVAGEPHRGEVVREAAPDLQHQPLQAGQPARAQLLDVLPPLLNLESK